MKVNSIKFFLWLTILSLGQFTVKAQTTSLPKYKMLFQFVDSRGHVKDTAISRTKYVYWSKSSAYPAYVKWVNLPFAILKSNLSGIGLFTDSVTSYAAGQIIGYAFFKVGSYGSFDLDYHESAVGSFVNDASAPNMNVVLTPQGIILTANQNIGPNTELTASYDAVINMFPNDQSVKRSIQYW
jgi:hypothetical protein